MDALLKFSLRKNSAHRGKDSKYYGVMVTTLNLIMKNMDEKF